MGRLTIAMFLLLFLLSTCDTTTKKISLEELQSSLNPYYSGFKGSFSISENGAVVYTLPIPVTPGIGGMTPQISLSYNSNNSTSILGEGWALSGFSYIGRSPNTNAIDTFSRAINFSESDKLALDGMRLLKTTGGNESYGAQQTAYYTENNGFKRIIIEEAGIERINGIKYFRVLSKDGIENFYGSFVEKENNQIQHNGIVSTSSFTHKNIPYLWLLTSSKDKNGNWIKYDYNIEKNTYKPSKITYGATGETAIGEVEFYYEENEEATESKWSLSKYVNGENIIINKPLKKIISRYLGEHNDKYVVREYNFKYDYDEATNRLLVTNIWQFVKQSDNDDDPEYNDIDNQIIFDWAKTKLYNKEFVDSMAKVNREPYALDEDFKVVLGDLNSDGFPDKVLHKNFGDKIVLMASKNTGAGAFSSTTLDTFSTAINKEAISITGDFNADGKSDLGFLEYTGNKISIYAYQSLFDLESVKNNFNEVISKDVSEISIPDFKKLKYGIGDFNSDGYSDLMLYFIDKDSLKYQVLTGAKNKFVSNKLKAIQKGSIPDDGFINLTTDINGDGISDLLFSWVNKDGWYSKSFIFRNTKQLGIDATAPPKIDDVSITKVKDYSMFHYQIDTPSGKPIIKEQQVINGDYSRLGNVLFSDINKDGNIDMIISNTDSKGWTFTTALGKGNGEFEIHGQPQTIIINIAFIVNQKASFGDFNGDGNSDLIIQKTDATGWYNLIAYGNGRGNFSINNSSVSSMNLLVKQNFSYSHRAVTDFVLPYCPSFFWRYRLIFDQGKLPQAVPGNLDDYQILMKNIRLQFPVETGFYPFSNETFRPFKDPVKDASKDFIPADLKFENNIKRVGATDPLGDSTYDSNCAFREKMLNYYTKVTYTDFWQPYVVDLNGDGISDLLLTYPRHVPSDTSLHESKNILEDTLYTFTVINQNKKPYLITEITHSNKNHIKLEYESVLVNVDTSLNGKKSFEYPYIPYTAPIYTVSKTKLSNGIGLDSLRITNYKYANGVYSLTGRGFLGFQQTKSINDFNGNYTLNDYWLNPEFMKKGLMPLKSTQTYVVDSAKYLVSKDSVDYTLVIQKNGTFNLFNKFQESMTFDLFGIQTSYQASNSQFDKFGNLSFSKSTNGFQSTDIITKETSNTFYETEASGKDWVDKWLLGRLHTSKIVTSRNGKSTIRVAEFTYNKITGQLLSEISDKQNKVFSITKEYHINKYGNIDTSLIYPTNNKQPDNIRRTITFYTKDNRFVNKSIDPEGYITEKNIDNVQGLIKSTTFANDVALTTSNEANPIGTFMTTVSPDSVISYSEKRICNQGEMAGIAAYYSIDTNNVTSLPVITYFNNIDQPIKKVNYDFREREIAVDYEYDLDGNLIRESFPYFKGESIKYISYTFDKLNRRTSIILPDRTTTIHRYHGFSDTTINAKSQVAVTQKNALGELVKSSDQQGYSISYYYDEFGRLIKMSDKSNRIYLMRYDLNGNRTFYKNPNFKTPDSAFYDAFSNKIFTKEPNGYTKNFHYDKLNRIEKIIANRPGFVESTVYEYIKQEETSIPGKGQIKSITSNSDDYPISEIYSYYSTGKLKSKKYIYNSHNNPVYFRNLSGATFNYFYEKNKLIKIDYPYLEKGSFKSFDIHYNYTHGTTTGVYSLDKKGEEVLHWFLLNTNALGQQTEYLLGDSILVKTTFDTLVNNLNMVEYSNGRGLMAGMQYKYDEIGNIIKRNDLIKPNLQDSIFFDSLNRVIETKTGSYSTKVTYNESGDLREKVFGKQYKLNFEYRANTNQYFSIKFTDLVSGSSNKTTNINYDNYGNQLFTLPYMIADRQESIVYNQYNKPYSIGTMQCRYAIDGSKNMIFAHSNDLEEENQSGNGTLFLNSLAEYSFESENLVAQKFNLIVNGKVVANHYIGKEKTEYLLNDGLNSVIAKCNDKGNLIDSFAYDIWGQVRNPKDWKYVFKNDNAETFNKRGFLNSVSFDNFGLIDFNARLYDPITGRFISVDPIISNKFSPTQFYNPYLYCQNNPTVYQDPNGKFFWVAIAIGAYIGASAAGGSLLPWEWNENWWKGAIVGGIMGYASAYLGPTAFGGGFWGTVGSGASIGFIGGFTSTLVNGGNFSQALENGFKGGFVGGVTAGFTFGIGTEFGHQLTEIDSRYFAKAAVHGINQGIASEALGGSFEHGFMAGSFTSLSTPLTNMNVSSPQIKTVISAMVGGTASSLGGGKFANGAISGAMIQMYNDNAGESSQSKNSTSPKPVNNFSSTERGRQYGNGFLSVDEEGGYQILVGEGFRAGGSGKFGTSDFSLNVGVGASVHFASIDAGLSIGTNNGVYIQGTYLGVGYQVLQKMHIEEMLKSYYNEFNQYIQRGTGY